MKVLLVIGSGRRGGAEGQLSRLAQELRGRGVDVRVALIGAAGPHSADLTAGGVPWRAYNYHGISPSRLWAGPEESAWSGVVRMARFRRDLRRWSPDIVHAWLPHAVTVALLGPGRERRIAAFRGQVLPGELGVLASLHVQAVTRADAVTVNSPTLVADSAIPWGADPDRIDVIPNGLEIAGPPADPRRDPPVAAVVANFLPYKGHAVLIDALTLVAAPLEVRMYGARGSALVDELRKRAADRGVLDRVTFVEGCHDIPDRLADAQFAIHPSLTEGLSNAVLEELAAGLPVIAARVGGNPTLITPGHNGDLVPPGDVDALARAIERMAEDVDYRARLAAQARPSVAGYSWPACADAHIGLYQRVLGQR